MLSQVKVQFSSVLEFLVALRADCGLDRGNRVNMFGVVWDTPALTERSCYMLLRDLLAPKGRETPGAQICWGQLVSLNSDSVRALLEEPLVGS